MRRRLPLIVPSLVLILLAASDSALSCGCLDGLLCRCRTRCCCVCCCTPAAPCGLPAACNPVGERGVSGTPTPASQRPPSESPGQEPIAQPPTELAEPPVEVPSAVPPDDDRSSHHDPGGSRRWTDASGQYHVEASFVSLQDGTVRLKKTAGGYCRIVFERLSPADQAFVRRHVESIAAR
jgi:hypothetical protein